MTVTHKITGMLSEFELTEIVKEYLQARGYEDVKVTINTDIRTETIGYMVPPAQTAYIESVKFEANAKTTTTNEVSKHKPSVYEQILEAERIRDEAKPGFGLSERRFG